MALGPERPGADSKAANSSTKMLKEETTPLKATTKTPTKQKIKAKKKKEERLPCAKRALQDVVWTVAVYGKEEG